MTEILRYSIVLGIMGLVGVPLAARALGRLPGAGLAFGRILAWLLLAWVIWMLSSLGIPNGPGLAIVGCLIVAGFAAFLWRHDKPLAQADPFRGRLWLWSEFLFFMTFLIALWLGSHSSDVLAPTEKPMDMMLMNSTLASDKMPPADPWMSGQPVNYYYLGHFMFGLLVRLTNVEPSAGYNLGVAVLFALCVSTAFVLCATIAEAGRKQGMAIKRPLGAGGAGVVLLVLMGNLRGGWEAWHDLKHLATFDYFVKPTRVIPNTINEFPDFSLTLGDLHAHVIAIPITLLAVAFIVQVGVGGAPKLLSLETFGVALTLGWLYGVNSWSWPVMVGLFGLTIGVWLTSADAAGTRVRTVLWGVAVVAGGIVLLLPFITNFDPNAMGFALTTAAKRETFGDFLRHHLVMEGALLWLLVLPLLARLHESENGLKIVLWPLGLFALIGPVYASRNNGGAILLALLLALTLWAAVTRTKTTVERTLFVLAAGAFACLLGSEAGIVKDEFFATDFSRMNTVFKMGYQAWLLLAVVGAVMLFSGPHWSPRRLPRYVWTVLAAGLIAVSVGYTFGGTLGRHAGLRGERSLDGRTWLRASAPGDIKAVDWIRAHTHGDAVVLEAVGDDYNSFGNTRIADFTGRPTVMGWQGHELQWRSKTSQKIDIGQRRTDVQTLYTTTDPVLATGLLARYKIGYAVFGPLEQTTYGVSPTLQGLGRKVFDQDGTSIYAFSR
ncbi:MAG: hypothetical protein QOF76_2018 [Solirubrobacteraceae bacterium]|nr:hypothetical protein [Solirubrobacteraceae bacterium]